MLGAFDAVKWRVRLQRDATDVRIEFSQASRRADESSSRPHDRYKMRDAAFGLLPDFVRGGEVMRAPVGVIGILVGIEIKIGMLYREFMGDAGGAVGTFSGIGEDDICAVCL